MKIELCLAIVCITILLSLAVINGIDGILLSTGVATIGGIVGWQSRRQYDKRGTNIAALKAALKRAEFTDDMIASIICKLERRK